jgi:hypothetical protein
MGLLGSPGKSTYLPEINYNQIGNWQSITGKSIYMLSQKYNIYNHGIERCARLAIQNQILTITAITAIHHGNQSREQAIKINPTNYMLSQKLIVTITTIHHGSNFGTGPSNLNQSHNFGTGASNFAIQPDLPHHQQRALHLAILRNQSTQSPG